MDGVPYRQVRAARRRIYDDVVARPGRFEGQPAWVPYFHESHTDGFSDMHGDGWSAFEVDDEDHRMFPELPIGDWIVVVEHDDHVNGHGPYPDLGTVILTFSEEEPTKPQRKKKKE